jgi:hypothetical protein
VADYFVAGRESPIASDYYNIWHHAPSVAQKHANKWLRRCLTGGVPMSAGEALRRAEFGALKAPRSVTVKPGSPYPVRCT